MHALKLTLGKIIIFANFPLYFQLFSVKRPDGLVVSSIVVCLSGEFLPRCLHSLNISSHSLVFVVSSYVILSSCAF
jgi:hypothetical protein